MPARRLPPLLPFVLLATLQAQQPATAPEASGYERTSRADEVATFLSDCTALPHGDRLRVRSIGTTTQNRQQLLVECALPTPPKTPRLRALVIGNIHAGEVEGKEALQQLVREFGRGEHGDVLARCDVWLLPIHNVDGNEALGPKNRAGQNGPDLVGQRQNGRGLDLNRDFVKAEAPETQNLLAVWREFDPHLFVDLHTTNGSYHGYHLTFAPGLSPNQDPAITAVSRTLLDDAQVAMRGAGFATFDYGNFETRDWDGGGAPESQAGVRGWYSYDHRARYGVNCFGLRNRIGILSEAYSYCDFKTRIAASHAFVLALLRGLVARADEVQAVTSVADQMPALDVPISFRWETTFAPPETMPVMVGAVTRQEASGERPPRFVRNGDGTPETMPVFRSFRAKQSRVLPTAWAIVQPTDEVVALLARHGVKASRLDAARVVQAETFAVTKKRKPKRPFQGHQELQLEGTWGAAASVELAAGTLLVAADQPLARLAATLLEPTSEDSLSTWNYFEAQTSERYPVLRVLAQH